MGDVRVGQCMGRMCGEDVGDGSCSVEAWVSWETVVDAGGGVISGGTSFARD